MNIFIQEGSYDLSGGTVATSLARGDRVLPNGCIKSAVKEHS